VNIEFASADASACARGSVACAPIDLIIRVINYALNGCPRTPGDAVERMPICGAG